MNQKMMSVLFAEGDEGKFNDLTFHRTTASLPFGGRYRLIDFALSNLVNSGVTRVGIVTKSNYSSLMDHIRQGRDWDLNRKNSGIAVFPPYVLNTARDVFKGKIEALSALGDYIRPASEDYIIIANCNVAANIDYQAILEEHIKNGAGITLVCKKGKAASSKRLELVKDDSGKVTELSYAQDSQDEKLLSLNMCITGKEYILDLVENAHRKGYVDFEKDILFDEVKTGTVYACELDSYVSVVEDINTYYDESMKLLDYNSRKALFGQDKKIYTKVKDSTPTVYGEDSKAKNCLIADGCEIHGTVENSILFRNVKINKGAVVRDCIIMEDTEIGTNAELNFVITDKGVTVRDDRKFSGFTTYPIVIGKNRTV
ncbi:MAG: glucose-1-phosphate adenylyltransferase subunit GlgD [Christensenellaceae bacterium]|jgi:glucose-1-phosphate adenylyltransferase|nr:glucose-1-phosphate adenylyltransferase subunit GlgD [Christensenellaceae bacterium]